MDPVHSRQRKGFRFFAPAMPLGLGFAALSSSSTLAQTAATSSASMMASAAPIAIFVGLTCAAVVASAFALRATNRARTTESQAKDQIAHLQARLDSIESLSSVMPRAMLIWDAFGNFSILGQFDQVSERLTSPQKILDFSSWMSPSSANVLQGKISALRDRGEAFDISLNGLDSEMIEAIGRATGAGFAVKFRREKPLALQEVAPFDDPISENAEVMSIEAGYAILSLLRNPAWLRDESGNLVYVNEAYNELLAKLGLEPSGTHHITELFSDERVASHLGELGAQDAPLILPSPLPNHQGMELILRRIDGGSVGYLRPNKTQSETFDALTRAHVPGVIDALVAPVVVFDAFGKLVHFNAAYTDLWDLDPAWLGNGQTEKSILDRLRTKNLLPAAADYQAWRNEHMKNYQLNTTSENTWHLPDGRTINFVVAPAAKKGGLIYVFEDVTSRLRLETEKKALVNAQRETLNALSEGVAVFTPDGKLRLHNPRLSAMWQFPTNRLQNLPHIDELTKMAAEGFPEDGYQIWADLKKTVVNLSPSRADATGRINRADGTLINYAAVHLPDGQIMLTFVDVTQSANFERMLQERNEALVTADRLKDAFVQSVSYELRSPLTNIIGFADLLASDAFGSLNERQRQYTDYIRAQSATLGVLIDNILDLTHVDAGIAELDRQPQNVRHLVEKAKAGLDATFKTDDGTGARALGQQVDLNISYEEDLPSILVDGKRIVQVLYNLLSNATKFSEPGTHVNLHVTANDDFVNFVIEDEGIEAPAELGGVPSDQFAGGEGRQRGAGIGLTIAQAFVQLHGGSISFTRKHPRGMRVLVHLPIRATLTDGKDDSGFAS